MYLIGLDIGTTGCKAMVFSPGGAICGHAFHEYEVICTEPAMAEQDAEQVWALTQWVLKKAIAQSGVRQEITALSISVQGDAIIPISKHFKARHRAILGMDYRAQAQASDCAARCGDYAIFQRTGMRAHPMNSLVKALYYRHRWPREFARTWKIVTYADFILGKMGAEPVIDYTMASRTMAFDLETRQWSQDLLKAVDMDASLFSKAVPSGTPVGTLRSALARELGLSAGVLLVTGAHDQCCAALGAGVVKSGIGVLSTGTAEVLSTAFDKPSAPRRMFSSYYPCYLHAKPGMYFTFALNHIGGILLKWYRDQFAFPEVADARKKKIDPYQLMDERMPAGPSPVMVVPHLNGSGTPWCDMQARGAVVGLTLATTRHDISKALLEALAFESLINLETMEACKIKVDRLVAAGGGAKSALWLQMKADILGRPIWTLRCRESACLGAGLLAGTAVGAYASLDEAAAETVRVEREFTPQPESRRVYQDRYKTYRKLYPLLKRVNAELPVQSIQD